MNPNAIAGHVEFADDVAFQSAEDAAEIVRAAEEEARYEVTRGAVLEHMTLNFSRADDRTFMKALRDRDQQGIAMMIHLIQKSFETVVAEKKSAILARKPEPDVH